MFKYAFASATILFSTGCVSKEYPEEVFRKHCWPSRDFVYSETQRKAIDWSRAHPKQTGNWRYDTIISESDLLAFEAIALVSNRVQYGLLAWAEHGKTRAEVILRSNASIEAVNQIEDAFLAGKLKRLAGLTQQWCVGSWKFDGENKSASSVVDNMNPNGVVSYRFVFEKGVERWRLSSIQVIP